MAEGALLQLAGRVLELMDSLTPEKNFSAVKPEIEGLKGAVSKIQAVILDAEKQSSRSDGIKYWLRELKDVLYDADDLLDSISTEVLRNKMKDEVRRFLSSIFHVKTFRQLRLMRERIDAISIERIKSQLDENFIDPQFMNRLTHSFARKDDVIGRENDKEEVLKHLFDRDVVDDISIIPIVGRGGLGKTRLAQLVYNDEIVERHFERRIWICVSDIFDFKRIVKEILEQLTKRKHEESLEILQNQLIKELKGKRYLIVFDDLWNENRDEWYSLRDMLMGGGRGSKIIVTTRSESVAKLTGTTSPHALKGLLEDQAWSLFLKMAFEQGQLPEHETFISMRKKIVEQCCGVPLAIKTIANLLYKASENELRSFINYEFSKIALEKNDILLTLKLSYDHLTPNLKQCFAYCRLFPKDCKIHIETLINLWAAQGFIKISNSEQRVEDVGREYFMELLSRSFFQDVEADKLGNIVCCKMHNLMHDLASLLAGKESSMLASSGENIGEKVRHISFDPEDLSCHPKDSLKQLPILMIKGNRIRTVLAASVGINLGKITCDALISNLNYLRTLDLSNLKLPAVPHSIGRLKHLRYLDLSKNRDIEILPNTITKLLNLQTLLLNDCDKLKELPQDIEKLVNLRHLDITCCFKLTHMPRRLGYLTSLEILPMFVVRQEGVKVSSSGKYKKKQATSSGGLSELKELSNLGGSLLIQYLGHGEDDILECKATYMNKKQHLQGLELRWEENLERDEEIECYDEKSLEVLLPHPNLKTLSLSYYMGMKIPSWVSSLTNLVNLELSKNRRLQHLPPLNHLPFLKFVTLIGIEALEYISKDRFSEGHGSSSSKTTFFPSLSSLRIEKCPNLKGWMNLDDDVNKPDHLLLPSFPCLFELRIVECPNLTSMPLFPHLKEILELRDSSLKVLQQTMEMEATTSTSSSSRNFPLSQLKVLSLDEIFDLDSLPDVWLRNLESLQTLYITKCLGLKSLPWMGNLTSIQRLFIHECPNLTSLPICDLKSLQHLAITGCPVLRQRYQRHTGEDWLNIAHVPHLDVDWNQQEIIASGQVPSSPVIKESKEISITEESGECEEETDADIETTLKAEGITPEKDESNKEDPSPSLFSEDKSSLPLTQGARESSLYTSQDPVKCSLPMSHTPKSGNEADVLTNTWSNKDGVQDLSFESVKVSEISELMDLPSHVHSLKIEECDDMEFIPQGQVLSSPVIKESKEISITEESGECEEETDVDIETTLKAEGITPEIDESNEEDPSPSLFSEDKSSLPLTQGARESSLSTSQDPVECSLPMSHTSNSGNEADVLTNTWSNQDGVQDLSFESVKVSEISELMDLPSHVHSLKIEECDDMEFIPQGQVLSSPVIKESKEISITEESGECEEETDVDIETTLKAEGITPEIDESKKEDPSPSLFSEDKSSLPLTQGARESSLSTSQDPAECSLPMSHTSNSGNEADVLTNTWSNKDGVQDLSFESVKVSEISKLMDLPFRVHSLKIEECDDLEFIPQGQVPSSPVVKESKEISETEESGVCEEETDADIETTLKAEGITPEKDESNEENPSPSLFSEDKSSLPLTQGAGESSLSTSRDPVECSLPMSHSPNSGNEADFLTNTWSNQDGVQDLSFESVKVSEISELMDLPSRVHSLKIEECDDLEFIPKGVMSCELSLQDLYIINCCSLKSFPEDRPPTALEILYIRNCKKLNFPLTTEKKTHQDALLKYLCIGSSCDSLKFLSLDLFPNLKSLSIWDCANLESLSMPVQKNLTSLEALEIRDCPNLVSFVGGGLCTPNLMSIWLSNCKKLKKLPEMHTLGSLQSVFINNCPELVSLSEKGLPSRLSLLSITFCNKLKLKDEWGLDGLEYLHRLEIEGGCVDMESFPEKFLSSNLSSLRISGLLNLKNLDKGFQKLTTLQRLEISCCPNLRSLPEDGFPSSLSFLCIKNCSFLTSKFRNKKGKDWSKIDHISCIEIDEEVIS